MYIFKNIYFKYFIFPLLLFIILELVLQIAYFLMKDRSFYSYHLNKNATFTNYTIHGGAEFKKNVLAHMPGYPDNLYTNKFGFVANDNFDHDLNNISKFNIFITGGSTVEGRGASSNKNTISSNLERCLNEKSNNIQVINAGFSGDFSYQEFLRSAGKIIPSYKTDVILHLGGKNDAHNPFSEGIYWKKNNQKFFKILDNSINSTKLDCISCSISNKLNRLSITFYSINYYLNKFLFNKKINDFSSNYTIASDNINVSSTNYLNNIKLMQNYYVDNNIKFYGFIQPYLHHDKKEMSELEVRHMDKFQIEYGINYNKYINNYFKIIINNDIEQLIDMTDLFKNNTNELYYDSFHYNDEGNKIIAYNICKFLKISLNL